MLSKEEVADVISYCKEHGCSYKERLAELGIPEWKFYDSKYKYAIRERKEFDKGRFLQLRTGSDGSMTPFPSFDSAKTGRVGRQGKPVHTAVQYAEHRAPDRRGYHDAHTGRDDSRPSGRHNTVVVTPCLALRKT